MQTGVSSLMSTKSLFAENPSSNQLALNILNIFILLHKSIILELLIFSGLLLD